MRKRTPTSVLAVLTLVFSAMVSAMAGTAVAAPPLQVLISESTGTLWSYDIGTGEVSKFATVNEGNFDIQFLGPRTLLIGNVNGFVSQLDMRSFQETIVTDSGALIHPVGVAVSPRAGGYYYFADLGVGIFGFDSRSSELDLLIRTEPRPDGVGMENVAVDKRGMVYFTSGPLLGRFDPSQQPVQVEEVAVIDSAYLNGLVVTPTGQVFVVSTETTDGGPVGVYQVDARTGEVTPIHLGAPLRNPEDVALAPNGDIYIIDSAYLQPPENHVQGLYRIPAGGGNIETLHTGPPFDDVVDILIAPFTGF